MKKNASRLGVILFFVLQLAACNPLAPRDVGNDNMFGLTAQVDESTKPRSGSVTIDLPDASAMLDTYRIAVVLADGRQDYVAGARWSDFLTTLVQSSLKDGFAQSNNFRNVSDDTDGDDGRFLLKSEITTFQIVYQQNGSAPQVQLRMSFNVVRATSGKSVKQFTVEKTQAAGQNSMAAIRIAFNEAFSALTTDAIAETSRATR